MSKMMRLSSLLYVGFSLLLFSSVFANVQIVGHAGGSKSAPGNSMASFRLCSANNLVIDADLNKSSDGELVFSHDFVGNRSYWNDLKNSPVSVSGSYKTAQFSDENFIRLEDLLSFLKNEATTTHAQIELKSHLASEQQLALDKIKSYGLLNRVSIWVLSVSEKNTVKSLNYGDQIGICYWAASDINSVLAAVNSSNKSGIDVIGLYWNFTYGSYSDKEVIDLVHNAGIKIAMQGFQDYESHFNNYQNIDFSIEDNPDRMLRFAYFNKAAAPVISSPNSGDQIDGTVYLKTQVYDIDNAISKVEFYANGSVIGTDYAVPYTLNWSASDGNYSVYAKVYDASGREADSPPISIKVGDGETTPQYDNKIINNDAPSIVVVGDSVSFNVDYEVSTSRDVLVLFQDASDNYKTVASQRVTVNQGTGTQRISLMIGSETNLHSNYKWAILLTTVGGGSDEKLEMINVDNVEVTSNVTTTLGERVLLQSASSSLDFQSVTVNSFVGQVRFQYTIPVAELSHLSFVLYDVEGRMVRQLRVAQIPHAGRHTYLWDGRNETGFLVSAGAYVLRLIVREQSGSTRSFEKPFTFLY